MAMTDCPYCFAAVDERFTKCPHCGTALRSSPVKKTEPLKTIEREKSQSRAQAPHAGSQIFKLFGHVGKSIQILAISSTIIGSVLCLLASSACVLLALIAWEDFFVFASLALSIAIFGPLTFWVEGLFICGFGLIVENAEVSLAKAAHK